MSAPSFFIVGAQKAGTTSLAAMLGDHPDVFMSDPKEPGYFIRGFGDAERWQSLKKPLGGGDPVPLSEVKQGVYTAAQYAALFSSPAALKAKHCGEASTPYLPSPHAARRIAQVVPGAKIVASLRDPVSRAYSAWAYNMSRGNENTSTFEEAIEQELAGKRDDWIWGSRYLHVGLYAKHLRRFHEHFAPDAVLVLKFEDFRADPAAAYARICTFLDLAPHQASAGERENVTVVHVNPVAARTKAALTTPSVLKSVAKTLLPSGVRKVLRRKATEAIDSIGERPPPMTQETRNRLADFFWQDCQMLRDMIDFDISDWAAMQHAGTAVRTRGTHG